MIKTDRGTILFVRVYEKGNTEPVIIDTTNNSLGGIILDGAELDKVFEENTLSGPSESLKSKSVGLIKNSGEVKSLHQNLESTDQLEKIELTVVYPDGTTKISERSGDNLRGTLIWEESLVRKIRNLNHDDVWTDNWRNNPAIIILLEGNLSTGCQQMSGC